MSKVLDIAEAHPTIIIRRRSRSDDDGHHGGVWKIAYADFMTAMMAFFLVMWLINSTDEKTIVQVAAYFNPMRLSEKSPSSRGLHEGTIHTQDPAQSRGDTQDQSMQPVKGLPSKDNRKAGSKRDTKKYSELEREIFDEPMRVLARIEASASDVPTSATRAASPTGGTEKRDALIDPFDIGDARQEHKGAGAAIEHSATTPAAAMTERTELQHSSPAAPKFGSLGEVASIEQELGMDSNRAANIDVQRTPEGLLISVFDDANFEMFEIASARPRPQLVALMSKVARLLQRSKATMVVRGHTDGRPFRTAMYDNWRLSSARAQMAYYMLVRSGISEERIERIEGYAGRKPRNLADVMSAENRRIDILLRADSQ